MEQNLHRRTRSQLKDPRTTQGWRFSHYEILLEKAPVARFFMNCVRKPMVVRLGHNYYDKTPLIGKIVDINIWDRYLHDSLNSFLI